MKTEKSTVNFNDLIQGEKPVLVDFTATWCGPCRAMAPILEDVKNKIGDRATIVKVDIDRNEQFASMMGIQGVPTFVLFKNGKEEWRHVGMISGQQLMSLLESHAEKAPAQQH